MTRCLISSWKLIFAPVMETSLLSGRDYAPLPTGCARATNQCVSLMDTTIDNHNLYYLLIYINKILS